MADVEGDILQYKERVDLVVMVVVEQVNLHQGLNLLILTVGDMYPSTLLEPEYRDKEILVVLVL